MEFQYTPSPFMLPTSHYDAKRADHAAVSYTHLMEIRTAGTAPMNVM